MEQRVRHKAKGGAQVALLTSPVYSCLNHRLLAVSGLFDLGYLGDGLSKG